MGHHHDGAGVALVLEGADAEGGRRVDVVRVDHRAAEPEHVRRDQPHEPHAGHVDDLEARAEPSRPRQGLDDRRPQEQPGRQQTQVLDRVDRAAGDRGVVDERDVPEDQVRAPERERDQRVRQERESPRAMGREQRPQDRSGHPQQQQQRRDRAQEGVLERVDREEPVLADRVDRREEGQRDHAEAGVEAGDAPGGRPPAAGAHGVEQAGQRDRHDLERRCRPRRHPVLAQRPRRVPVALGQSRRREGAPRCGDHQRRAGGRASAPASPVPVARRGPRAADAAAGHPMRRCSGSPDASARASPGRRRGRARPRTGR